MADSQIFQEYAKTPREGAFDFYRCFKCGRVFSREQELLAYKLAALAANEDNVSVCPCGSQKFSPAWPVGLDWLRPAILRYTLKLILARGLAPWLDRHFKAALPLVERMVRHKEA